MVVGLVSEDSVVVSTVDVAVGLGVGFFVGVGVGFFVGVALGFAVGVGDGTVSDGVSEVAVVPDVVPEEDVSAGFDVSVAAGTVVVSVGAAVVAAGAAVVVVVGADVSPVFGSAAPCLFSLLWSQSLASQTLLVRASFSAILFATVFGRLSNVTLASWNAMLSFFLSNR